MAQKVNSIFVKPVSILRARALRLSFLDDRVVLIRDIEVSRNAAQSLFATCRLSKTMQYSFEVSDGEVKAKRKDCGPERYCLF